MLLLVCAHWRRTLGLSFPWGLTGWWAELMVPTFQTIISDSAAVALVVWHKVTRAVTGFCKWVMGTTEELETLTVQMRPVTDLQPEFFWSWDLQQPEGSLDGGHYVEGTVRASKLPKLPGRVEMIFGHTAPVATWFKAVIVGLAPVTIQIPYTNSIPYSETASI